jgi:serine/threonine protein kinase
MTDQKTCERCGTDLESQATISGLCPRCLIMAGMGEDSAPRGPWEPPSIGELAPHFPQLELVELVGRGGAGAVYLANQKNLGRQVALKVMPQEVSSDPTFAERFEREARVLAQLDHPGIVQVYDAGKAGPYYYLVMEYVNGANVREMIRTGAVKPNDALKAVTQICEALQYAHDRGVVHRDIKPENILVDKSGSVKLADFGLAKIVNAGADSFHLTRTDQAMGTPHYMAPEQYDQPLSVDHRADIYSLGVVFYELLTGEVPMGSFEAPSARAEVDSRLDGVVMKTLHREPSRRYQSAGEINTDLENMKGAPARRATAPRQEQHSEKGSTGLSSIWKVLGCMLLSLGCLVPAMLAISFMFLGARAPVSAELSSTQPASFVVPAPQPVSLQEEPEWVEFTQGLPVLQPSAVGLLSLDKKTTQEANEVLRRAWQAYIAFEEEARTRVREEQADSMGGVTTLKIFDVGGFREDRLDLEAQVGAGISRLLKPATLRTFQEEFDLQVLFPFGEFPCRVTIDGPDASGSYVWGWSSELYGGANGSSKVLPGGWEHLLSAQ